MPTLQDRFIGSLLGLATGDALGAPVEFFKRGEFEHVSEMIGGGKFSLQPGVWTDDTAMTLCLADSLLEKDGFDARDQMEKYWQWYLNGYRSCTGVAIGVGSTVQHALVLFQAKPERDPFIGLSGFQAQGNGSLMRMAPAALFFSHDTEQAIFWSGESSRVTHGSPMCIDSCRYMSALICGALEEKNKTELRKIVPSNLCDEIRTIAELPFEQISINQIKSGGYVLDTLTAALWAFFMTDTFEEGLIRAVNLGDDSDTVGAIYGQLAGVYYGIEAIPHRWLEKLQKREEIEAIGQALFERKK